MTQLRHSRPTTIKGTTPAAGRANGMPAFKPYTYRGTGTDILTPGGGAAADHHHRFAIAALALPGTSRMHVHMCAKDPGTACWRVLAGDGPPSACHGKNTAGHYRMTITPNGMTRRAPPGGGRDRDQKRKR